MDTLLIWCDDPAHCDEPQMLTTAPDPEPPAGAYAVNHVGRNEDGWVPVRHRVGGKQMRAQLRGTPLGRVGRAKPVGRDRLERLESFISNASGLHDGRWDLACRCGRKVRVKAADFDAVAGLGYTGVSLAALEYAKRR